MINVGTFDMQAVREELKGLRPNTLKNASKRAIFRTGQGATALVVKSVREQKLTTAPAARLKTMTAMEKRFDATPPMATLQMRPEPIPARYFFPKIVKFNWRRGVQLTILGKTYLGGFPLDAIGPRKMKAAKRFGPNTQVMKRQTKAGKTSLVKFYSPSLADLVKFSGVEGETRLYIAGRLARELAHEIKRAIRA